MLRGQIFRLYPTRDQATYFAKACGVARFAWNWGLALRERYYRATRRSLSHNRLQRQWVKAKHRRFRWAAEVTKHAPEMSLFTLARAYRQLLPLSQLPRFKRKGHRDSFCAATATPNGGAKLAGQHLILPKVGAVRFRSQPRWPEAVVWQVKVSLRAGRWYASIAFDITPPQKLTAKRPGCGIDLGCLTFATIASGGKIADEIPPPKPYAKAKRRLKRLCRRLSRRKKGGANRKKASLRVARCHQKIANIRNDSLHKLTTRLVRQYSVITVEDLNVRGLAKNRRLAGTIYDLGWYEFRRQLAYKCEETGARLIIADRFFPSTKMCHNCGKAAPSIPLAQRDITCAQCGANYHRDHNAAINLERVGREAPEPTPAEIGEQSMRKRTWCRSKKQERSGEQ